ncbi:HAD hydrolase-like protein [Heliobacterium gestii]|uniref:HAD hydrolase-like protein n=1 Tax=Heliomicrobium gestii TaxID=2699 RepID=A0A845L8G3_HELGE|nr:HAD family hydrolase [Heliomicrobium gestii]MBM7865238.1 phosphoglycolate phosphatase-like HAD superfamily hydrolase [Heliomicrobium gestii]MZP41504.1 HAD hydrolase-like protein [Heliomicrobium gestii]
MAAYDLILFDLDGTLTDPKEGITKSVQYALAKHGIHVEDRGSLIPFIGPPLLDSFRHFYGFDEGQARQAVADYREYFAVTGMYENAVFPGIPALFEDLTAAGKQLAVATSKPTVFAKQILSHFGLDGYFTHIVGSNLDGTRCVKGEVVAAALELFPEVDRRCVIMVGDREHDIIGAKANGIASLAVAYGYGSLEELEAAGADQIAGSIDAIAPLLAYPVLQSILPSGEGQVVIGTVPAPFAFAVLSARVLADAVDGANGEIAKAQGGDADIRIIPRHRADTVSFEVNVSADRCQPLWPVVAEALSRLHADLPAIKREAERLERSCRK